MAKHTFGGRWTEDKLERLRKYLRAYTNIFNSNPGARHFKTIYVDAFAGTGDRVPSDTSNTESGVGDENADAEKEGLQKGSTRIALEVEPTFDRFLFFERNAQRIQELEELRAEHATRRREVRIERGDANELLQTWCAETDWRKHRAVVFLDPYGMQVNWDTIIALARTQAIDLWWLFPLGMGVNRMLTRRGLPPPGWDDRLDRCFGTKEWRAAFYSHRVESTLFGPDEYDEKSVNFDGIIEFVIARLKTVFAEVAKNPLPLRNSSNTPIYLFCFAAGNPKGAKTAVKIAQHILKP